AEQLPGQCGHPEIPGHRRVPFPLCLRRLGRRRHRGRRRPLHRLRGRGARVRLWVSVVVLFCLPPVILLTLLALHVVGVSAPTAQSRVPIVFFGGCSIGAAGWAPDVAAVLRRREPVGATHTLTMWVALVIGLLTWASIPVVLVLGGSGA